MSPVADKLVDWGILKPKGASAARGPQVTAAAPRPAVSRANPAAKPVGEGELERKRGELAKRFADLQWDLGGLAYEMASRDHFRVDVLTRRAAALQEVDAELAELDRLLKLKSGGAAGSCESCGALYARGAGYCWHCGIPLIADARPPVASERAGGGGA